MFFMAEEKDENKKPKRRRYKSYAWIHPKTKKLYARVRIIQPDGTLKAYYKPASNLKHADQLAAEMLDDYTIRKTGFIEGERMVFDELAKWYLENKVVPPIYSPDGTKVSGMRTYKNVRLRIEKLQKFLGKMPVKTIDEDVLMKTKIWLKKNLPNAKKPASINRYLEDLRAMLRIALRKRWIKESPFDFGERVIDSALEEIREVILTSEQETVLLHIAKSREKTLLYYAMLCLLDSGARPSEIYEAGTMKGEPVTWNAFFIYDFQAVKLISLKGRKKKVRIGPVTARLEKAMRDLWNSFETKPKKSDRVFPVRSFKTSWTKVRAKAAELLTIAEREKMPVEKVIILNDQSIKEFFEKYKSEDKYANLVEPLDIRLRDFRRNLNTRLANGGMESHLREKLLGHEMTQTNFDYLATDLKTALEARKMLDAQIIEIGGIN